MIYGSLCSGMEAATVAWHPLGWRPSFVAEIDPFPAYLLHARYGTGRPLFMPDPEEQGIKMRDRKARALAIKSVSRLPVVITGLRNMGDITQHRKFEHDAIDLLVGGTPCQSFSIAGLRQGMADPRGNLAIVFLANVERTRPRWVVWENVPGVLSNNEGRDFAAFVGGLVELGYGVFWRVLDAQYFGVPQRRRRVFVVGYIGDWRPAAAVLSECEGLCGYSAPSRQAGTRVAPLTANGVGASGADDNQGQAGHLIPAVSPTLRAGGISTGGDRPPGTDVDTVESLIVMAHGQANAEIAQDIGTALTCNHEAPIIAHTLRGEGFDASEDGSQRGIPLISVATPILEAGARTGKSTTDVRAGMGIGEPGDPMYTLQANKQHAVAVEAFRTNAAGDVMGQGDHSAALTTQTDPSSQIIAFSCKDSGGDAGSTAPTLRAMNEGEGNANAGGQVAVAFAQNQLGEVRTSDVSGTLNTNSNPSGHYAPMVAFAQNSRDELRLQGGDGDVVGALAAQPGMKQQTFLARARSVRRLTPRECERLQGFPDDWTLVPYPVKLVADGPRYKAIGNSMAVPVMHWIGQRVQAVEDILNGL